MSPHHSFNRLRSLSQAILLSSVMGLAGSALAVASSPALAVVPISVPSAVYYGVGGPVVPIPVSFTTEHATDIVEIDIDGFVTAASCQSGGLALVTTSAAGSAIIEQHLPIGVQVSCSVTISIPDDQTPPRPGTVIVNESDVQFVSLGRRSVSVDYVAVTVIGTGGEIRTASAPYVAGPPLALGDELRYSVTFNALVTEPLTVTAPAGTTVTGCEAAPTGVTCVLTRALSVGDFAATTAPMTATLNVGGFPVALVVRDVPVFAERRVAISAAASPRVARIGESVDVTATLDNQGTLALDHLVLSGAGVEGALVLCAGVALPNVMLQPLTKTVCSYRHLATAVDIDATTPLVVRASSPVPGDSDLVDDDPTSATDVDAITTSSPFSVTAASIAASLSFGDRPVWIDDAGIDTATMTATVSTVGALSQIAIAVPRSPASGVAFTSCDTVVGDDCVMNVATIASGGVATVDFTATIDREQLGPTGLDHLQIPGKVTAAGGVSVNAQATTLSTVGLVLSLHPALTDATGATVETAVHLTTSRGIALQATFDTKGSGGIRPVRCASAAGVSLPLVPSGSSVTLGMLAAGSEYDCVVTVPVPDGARAAGSLPIVTAVEASAEGTSLVRTASATLPTVALQLVPGEVPNPPVHGYSVEGSPDRPNSLTLPYNLVVLGPIATDLAPIVHVAATDECSPSASNPISGQVPIMRWSCWSRHAISAADLEAGSYNWSIAVGVDGTKHLSTSSTVPIPLPHEDLRVTVTELSAPGSRGYRVGSEIRFLVQITNTGSLPIVVSDVTPSHSANSPAPTNALRSALTTCPRTPAVPPGATVDCDVSHTLIAADVLSGAFGFSVGVSTSQGIQRSASVVVTVDAGSASPRIPVGGLPATGADVRPIVGAGLLLLLVGLSLVVLAGRRSERGSVSEGASVETL